MEVISTKINGVYILIPKVFEDERGFFLESWDRPTMEKAGLYYDFVQDNHSLSRKKGTLRGIHFQKGAYSQAKLARCVRGAILDVAVDLRPESPTYKQWISCVLSSENKRQFLVPRGFGYGVLSLTDNAELMYKADNRYVPEADGGIRWDDPDIGVDWGITAPILSEKDRHLPFLSEIKTPF